MSKKHSNSGTRRRPAEAGGFLGGLTTLIEKLGELAEKGEELKRSGEIHGLDPSGKLRGVYGFTIKTGLGTEHQEMKVEPFGNLRQDVRTGEPVVHEVREPMVDVFEEGDEVLVVAEMPGVGIQDAEIELNEDILVIKARHKDKKYHKEVLLPRTFTKEQMASSCRNGVLEIRLGPQQEQDFSHAGSD